MDLRIARLCKALGLTYTRYADDLTISGEKKFFISRTIESIIKDEGFIVNDAKTKKTEEGKPVKICGLVLENGHIRIPLMVKKKLRAAIHKKNWPSALGLASYFFLADDKRFAKDQLNEVMWMQQQDKTQEK